MPEKKTFKNKSFLSSRWLVVVFCAILFGIIVIAGRTDVLASFLAKSFPSDDVLLGKVISVQETQETLAGTPSWIDAIRVRFLTGSEKGQGTVIHNIGPDTADPAQKVGSGETILLAKSTDQDATDAYYMTDRYRLPSLLLISLLFIGAVALFAGIRGITSLLGLAASVAILLFFVVPRILAGENAVVIGLIGSIGIAIVSLYLAHGFNRKTTIAVIGTLITLGMAACLALGFTAVTHLLGIGTEESSYLKIDVATIDLRGVLFAGIMIGMLGILDDVTIGQTHTVAEIHDANPELEAPELYDRAANVGKEHIASLVNTLFLAYAGAFLPLVLLLAVQSNTVPIWLAVNGEPITEEIVRALVGSMSLIAAVPITTYIAARSFAPKKKERGMVSL